MIPLSVLDLVPIREGESVSLALENTALLAQAAEAAGYARFWTAEHHGSEGLAGGAVSVVLAHVGKATSTIRIGAGGIMLPNHSPFAIAEQFGTLDALFPGRVDLGLGRAPGAGGQLAHALRKDLMRSAEVFPQDVLELQALFAGEGNVPLKATPGAGAAVQMWILGSSLFGAQLAAHLGLPYAFASHFAPAQLDAALATYRANFRPSAVLERPHAMAAMTVICADTDEEAELLSTSLDQSFVDFRLGRPARLKPPVPGFRESLPPQLLAGLDAMRGVRAVGSPKTVAREIGAFVKRTGADELILGGAPFDPAAHRRSLALTMQGLSEVKDAAEAARAG